MASTSVLLLFLVSSLLLFSLSEAQGPPVAKGLSYTFYKSQCPEGCDASVLLDWSAGGPSEQEAPRNLTLRPSAFKAIDDLRAVIDEKCGPMVSCADVVALAARDSVFLSGGPDYCVPLGRRDRLQFATRSPTLASLPAPMSNTSTLIAAFSKLNLKSTDLVALSGGHTIGISHCSSFSNCRYPNQDSTMDNTLAKNLYKNCPARDATNTTTLDVRSPKVFDNMYFADLVSRQGLLTSDQGLYGDDRTRGVVSRFVQDQRLFLDRFVAAAAKMEQLSVLTGRKGEVRRNCSAMNGGEEGLWSVVDGEGENPMF